jgi:hypothetical protein
MSDYTEARSSVDVHDEIRAAAAQAVAAARDAAAQQQQSAGAWLDGVQDDDIVVHNTPAHRPAGLDPVRRGVNATRPPACASGRRRDDGRRGAAIQPPRIETSSTVAGAWHALGLLPRKQLVDRLNDRREDNPHEYQYRPVLRPFHRGGHVGRRQRQTMDSERVHSLLREELLTAATAPPTPRGRPDDAIADPP